MQRMILILAVLCAGCESASSQSTAAPDPAPGYTARERQLIEMCNEIAIEREILAAKYNAMIEAHNLDMRPEPLTVKRCTLGGKSVPRRERWPEPFSSATLGTESRNVFQKRLIGAYVVV